MLKSKTKKIMAAAAGMLLLCSVAAAETAGLQTVTKAGSNASCRPFLRKHNRNPS